MTDAPQAGQRGDGLVSKFEQLQAKLGSAESALTARLDRIEEELEAIATALDNVQKQGQAPAARQQRYDPPEFHYEDRIWAPAPRPIGRGEWAVDELRLWWDAVAEQRTLVQRGGVLVIGIVAAWLLYRNGYGWIIWGSGDHQ